jgi:hypothetical protein
MRALTAALLAAAALAGGAASAPAATPPPRALIAFLPAPRGPEDTVLDELAARPELALGLTSPTLGGFSREQMAIDISQGARISTRAYRNDLPRFRLVPEGQGARIDGWHAAVRRADRAPGDVTPGLFAQTILGAGGRVAYAGVDGAERSEAMAAADESGRIATVSLGPASSFAQRAIALWRSSSLLVARLPDGPAGPAALDRLLDARGPRDFLCVVQAPPLEDLRLLPTGIAAPGYRGVLRSATTRRDGLVAATDVSPTVLDWLGLHVPGKMQGERIDYRAGRGAAYVRDLKDRLDDVLPHRSTAVLYIACSWALLLAFGWLLRRREGLRAALRIAFLGALWLPAIALLTAALSPPAAVEALILALGGVALGALSDRGLPWPAAPLLPAAVSFLANAIDLARGSRLIGLSIAGPNPKGGSRFFGVGNELEIVLAITVLIGAAAALTLLPRRLAPRGFALACLVAGIVIGAGRLGADVGGVITLGAGGAAAVVMSLPGGPTRRAVALAVIVPLFAVGALVGLDLLTGGGAHLSRTLSSASGPGDLAQVVIRRLRLSVAGLTKGTTPVSVGIALALLVYGVVRRRDLLRPLAGPREQAFRAGLVGAFFATAAGALANDSGPMIVLIGTGALLLALGYAHGRTAPGGRR